MRDMLPEPIGSELLTVEKFEAWLRQQPDSRAFERGFPLSCPLACYLRDNTGRLASVDGNTYKFLAMAVREPLSIAVNLPDWACDFVDCWDQLEDELSSIGDATAALETLQHVLKTE